MFIHLTNCNKSTVLPHVSPSFIYFVPPPFTFSRARCPTEEANIAHILIKVAVLSREIRGCIFKLSITHEVKWTESEPVIHVRPRNFTARG